MTAVRQYVLHCDHPTCRDWVKIEKSTLAEARKKARTAWGWRTKRRGPLLPNELQDLCPKHH